MHLGITAYAGPRHTGWNWPRRDPSSRILCSAHAPPIGAEGGQGKAVIRLIIEDLRTQREGLLSQGFWALLCYRLSHLRLRCRVPVLRQGWFVLNRLAGKATEMTTGIMIAESATIGRRLVIEHFGNIIVHGATVIGDDCVIRQGVTIGNRHMNEPMAAPKLGNRVQVGAGAKLLGRITIGDDAVIGANAVVVKDVPAGAVAVGVPAQIKLPRTAGKINASGS